MDKRPIIYSTEQGRSFDLASGWQDSMVGDSEIAAAVLGSTITTVGGFTASQTATPSLTINLAAGAILQEADIDATAYGPLQADTNKILQYGSAPSGSVTLSTAALTAGQSQWVLVQATFSQVDSVAPSDPNGGVLLYYNSTNPAQPYQGPGNSGAQQNTLRSGVAAISLVYGTPTSTGSEIPPSAAAGNVGLYLIDLTYGQTQITDSQILVAGPSVGPNVPSGYPYAPFLAGLLNSHHSGTPGQAPKINLTTEVQGVLPFTSLEGGNSAGQLSVTAATASGQAANLSQVVGAGASSLPDHGFAFGTNDRNLSTTYTNSSDRPLWVKISYVGNVSAGDGMQLSWTVNGKNAGFTISYNTGTSTYALGITDSILVPPGATYEVAIQNGLTAVTGPTNYWLEY